MSNTQATTPAQASDKGKASTGSFVRDNQKSLLFIAAAILAIVAIYFIYQKVYIGPREQKAVDQMHVAQDAWANKDWDKAIKGDGSYPGFEKIVSEYSNTKAANLASYYLGVAYLNKGEFKKAIDSFNGFHGDDAMVSAQALGGIGDAYVELKDNDQAASYFQKAADKAKNKFLTPFYLKKLGIVNEAKNDFKGAAEAYKQIKDEYPASTEAQTIDGYIARAEAKL
ncbi:tetratricopeptide repeat protein [Mucilaginibacter myungsuensis]|uniref:Tetratricopeptide repeat protein n=1 Tax=Mucilaginibacter myungsuensis TaxID=649104 RepID=A0A929KVV3_9SPHI|nr:tetratricopeptide repeat protein [Mucilaginibacter myungsuensis]MBE9661393.1 tetratricopeptide repeat protein [Mucilaginibacter myungsuensis]MDN3597536.1 tetratricopeptide repeat protein [Mucilaginibacter myungsuensis]